MTFNADDFAAVTDSIDSFNKMYGLATSAVPGFHFCKEGLGTARAQVLLRLDGFKKTLADELKEVEEIENKLKAGDLPEEVLTDVADWLGDIIVYCLSEMRKYGLDPAIVLGIIMSSNMSKLGPDGKPIYDSYGKVLKGPNYWRPEPALQRYIGAAIRQSRNISSQV